MSGRRLLAPALVTAALATPAGASAAGLPHVKLASSDVAGVSAKKIAGGRIRITFSHAPTARAALARMAGRKVRVTCTEFGPASLSGGRNLQGKTSLKLPKRATTLFLNGLTRPYEVCSFAVAGRGRAVVIALNATGRAFLADVATTHVLRQVLARARTLAVAHGGDAPSVAELHSRMRHVVGLKHSTDTPTTGRIGFFSDGHDHIAAVKVSPGGGRRLFYDVRGDVITTNVLRVLARVKVLDG